MSLRLLLEPASLPLRLLLQLELLLLGLLLQSLAIDLDNESSSSSSSEVKVAMFSVQSLPQLPLRPVFRWPQKSSLADPLAPGPEAWGPPEPAAALSQQYSCIRGSEPVKEEDLSGLSSDEESSRSEQRPVSS